MTKREKTIVAIMILSVIYAACIYFSGPSQKINNFSLVHKNSELFEFAKTLNEKITSDKIPLKSNYIIKTALAQWLTDPFMISRKPLRKEKYSVPVNKTVKRVVPQNTGLNYTGYLEINDKKFAIINGIEYEKGETLDLKKNYYLRSISPNRVIIAKIGQPINFILHLEEIN